MRSLKLYFALFLVVFLQALGSNAARPGITAVEKCLNVSTNQTTGCMRLHLKPKTIDSCYKMSETIFSTQSKENVKNYCFYEISEFPTLKSCVDSAKIFYMAEDKDHALFECVRQFANKISVKSCLGVSKMMTLPVRASYLEGQCYNL
jgi:hypothetical protein